MVMTAEHVGLRGLSDHNLESQNMTFQYFFTPISMRLTMVSRFLFQITPFVKREQDS
jgi:hypothetical protein